MKSMDTVYSPRGILARVLGLAAGLALATCARAGELQVAVEGIEADAGQIMVQVGDRAAFEAGGDYAASVILPARRGRVAFTTDALVSGDYAVRVMHDENGNGELDTNLVGIPQEPWGFSNDARGRFGPPGFDDARFRLDGDRELTVRLGR